MQTMDNRILLRPDDNPTHGRDIFRKVILIETHCSGDHDENDFAFFSLYLCQTLALDLGVINSSVSSSVTRQDYFDSVSFSN